MNYSTQYRKSDLDNSKWLHSPGEKHTFDVRVFHVGRYGRFETIFQHIMKDQLGNVIVYSGPNPVAVRMTNISFEATVKKHYIYKGVKQTIVTDLRLLDR